RFNIKDKVYFKDEKYNVLLMGGGRGLFDFSEDFVRWLDDFNEDFKDKLHITIVTGKNEKLFNNLTVKKPLKNIAVLGFVTNMPDLLRDNDLLVTKPGGATLFEAINAQIPIIIKTPKVGQEIENSKFIIDKGIGIVYNNESELQEIFDLMVNGDLEHRINFMLENLVHVKKNINPEKIGDYVMELL
ncbi:MAG: glycosyltransferase, partial [Intestinibacter bartlettii]|uniref:glycosyltransferase n=1 Tax=Intestinibacter bartlettii TaxID=261299 RepID=UPI002902BF62